MLPKGTVLSMVSVMFIAKKCKVQTECVQAVYAFYSAYATYRALIDSTLLCRVSIETLQTECVYAVNAVQVLCSLLCPDQGNCIIYGVSSVYSHGIDKVCLCYLQSPNRGYCIDYGVCSVYRHGIDRMCLMLSTLSICVYAFSKALSPLPPTLRPTFVGTPAMQATCSYA